MLLGFLCGSLSLSGTNYDIRGYYKTLRVAHDASQDDIKKSYRRLAKQWHPDKNNQSIESTAAFQRIAEAYETLSNPEKRTAYDRLLPDEEASIDEGPSYSGSPQAQTQNNSSQKNHHSTHWNRFKKGFTQPNLIKRACYCGIVGYVSLVGCLKIIQLCSKEDAQFAYGTFSLCIPTQGNATVEKAGLCSFKFSIPL